MLFPTNGCRTDQTEHSRKRRDILWRGAIVAAISSLSGLLASPLASLKSTMTESFGDMSLATEETDLQTANLDEHDTRAVHKQETGPREPQTVEKG